MPVSCGWHLVMDQNFVSTYRFTTCVQPWIQNVCATLPVLHAITGCDTVSAFGEMGKITAWNVTEL